MKRWLVLLAALLAAGLGPAHAHKPSDSYLTLDIVGDTIAGQWDIALRDLDVALGLDADQDDAITWSEVKARHADIALYALTRLTLGGSANACPAVVTEHLIDHHSDGAYAVLRFSATCATMPKTLPIAYRLFFELDPQHRGLVQLRHDGNSRAAIFAAESADQSFTLAKLSKWEQFADYGREGVWHIWTGFDHVLFLLSLLLPAVLVRAPLALRAFPPRGSNSRLGRPGVLIRSALPGPRWQPADSFRAAFIDVVKVVTAFTLAHSITLSLAALGVVSLPSRWVESAIALSVVLAALNNLRPLVYGKRWAIAFGFGLIHGFGFASVLADLGLPQESLLIALLAFNLGVELGQLVIVGVFLPIAWKLRATAFYRRVIVVGGSVIIASVAALWLVERALDLRIGGA